MLRKNTLVFYKISIEDNLTDYYYKLDFGDYYLVYEDRDKISGSYLIHLYEFVLDDIYRPWSYCNIWLVLGKSLYRSHRVYNDGLEGN